MRPRAYFSFDHSNDLHEACSIISSVRGVVSPADGFPDLAELDRDKGVERIRRLLKSTSVTVVLIGSNTALSPWVEEELRLSLERGNGILGLYIHHFGPPGASRGTKPVLPGDFWFPAYDWDGDLKRFAAEVKLAVGRSVKNRKLHHMEYFPALGW